MKRFQLLRNRNSTFAIYLLVGTKRLFFTCARFLVAIFDNTNFRPLSPLIYESYTLETIHIIYMYRIQLCVFVVCRTASIVKIALFIIRSFVSCTWNSVFFFSFQQKLCYNKCFLLFSVSPKKEKAERKRKNETFFLFLIGNNNQ